MDGMALTSEGKAVGRAGLAGVGIRRLVLDTGTSAFPHLLENWGVIGSWLVWGSGERSELEI